LNNTTAEKLIVYPNSSGGEVMLLGGKSFENAAVVITDTKGVVVFKGRIHGQTKINLNHLANGVYLLRADQGTMVVTRKIRIEKQEGAESLGGRFVPR
jgi:hypothetical protein